MDNVANTSVNLSDAEIVRLLELEASSKHSQFNQDHYNEQAGLTLTQALREIQTIRAKCAEQKRYLDEIAQVLHPHKPADGWTYLPQQLAGMVETLRGLLRESTALVKLTGWGYVHPQGGNVTVTGVKELLERCQKALGEKA